MKVEMIFNWGGLKAGSVYVTNEKTGNFLLKKGLGRDPVKYAKKGDNVELTEDKPKRRRSLKK